MGCVRYHLVAHLDVVVAVVGVLDERSRRDGPLLIAVLGTV